jgi:hypothetical protein
VFDSRVGRFTGRTTVGVARRGVAWVVTWPRSQAHEYDAMEKTEMSDWEREMMVIRVGAYFPTRVWMGQ